MSMAWEVTEEDVETVLEAHGEDGAEEVFDDYIVSEDGRIENAVLQYTDFEDQCAASMSEIEDILMEEEVIPMVEKKFNHE